MLGAVRECMTVPPETEREWDPDTYDDAHSFVYEYGQDVLAALGPREGERILDLGCGTGHLTGQIAAAGANSVGLDRSRAMLETAREEHPGCQFVRADARQFAFGRRFDAVLSNAALHWIEADEQDDVLSSVGAALSPGGRFVLELGGRGNVRTIVEAVEAELEMRGYRSPNPWYFPALGEYAARLERHGFEVRRATLFDRPTELEGGPGGLATWLDMFGDGLLAPVEETNRDDIVSAVERRLRPALFDDGTWTADYRRLRIEVVRREAHDR